MGKRVLLGVDGSERCLNAISTAGQLFMDQTDYDLVLYHCVRQLSSLYPGEICGRESAHVEAEKKKGDEIILGARRSLLDGGFPQERLQTKLKLDSADPVQDILSEASAQKIETIVVGRRGLSRVKSNLLGSVSSAVVMHSNHHTVWVVDTPVHRPQKVLVAVEGIPECHILTQYASDYFGSVPDLKFTFTNLIPSVPPTLWDDGHILTPDEQKERNAQTEKWRTGWRERVEEFMADGREFMIHSGVAAENVETRVESVKQGISEDLLDIIAEGEYQIVIIGKKSFQKRAPFLLGSHANKLLNNVSGVVLCMVG